MTNPVTILWTVKVHIRYKEVFRFKGKVMKSNTLTVMIFLRYNLINIYI